MTLKFQKTLYPAQWNLQVGQYLMPWKEYKQIYSNTVYKMKMGIVEKKHEIRQRMDLSVWGIFLHFQILHVTKRVKACFQEYDFYN